MLPKLANTAKYEDKLVRHTRQVTMPTNYRPIHCIPHMNSLDQYRNHKYSARFQMGFKLYNVFVFLDTFMVYASLHALRAGWSYSKPSITAQFGVSKEYLGIVDALYLVFYSTGMIVMGSFMHRFKLKNYVLVGLTVSSVSYMLWMVLYAATGFFNVGVMTVLMCVNGFFQATGWPGIIGIFSLWFSGKKKGFLMGVWSCSANIGDIIASALLNLLSDHNANLAWNFVLTGGMGLLTALSILLFLKEKPEPEPQNTLEQSETDKKLLEEDPAGQDRRSQSQSLQTMENEQIISKEENEEAPEARPSKYGIFSVLLIPKVPMYVFSYACLKGCFYGLLFWLPTLLDEHSGPISDQKGYISAMLDIGAVTGGLFVGFLADFFNKKALFLSPSLLAGSITMFLISFALGEEVWPYYVTIFCVGFFISGPYNIIGTLMAIEIGNSLKEKGGVAKVSSLNEGFAAILTTVEMIIIPHLSQSVVFYIFSVQCLIATILLIPPFLQDLKPEKIDLEEKEEANKAY